MSADPRTARLSDSHTEMTELLTPEDTNDLGRALGGVVLHWMDLCSAVAAMRFASRYCVTASIDHVDFHSPVELGELAEVHAYVFEARGTSLDVKVDVVAENPRTGERRDAADSFLTYVALDEEGEPTPAPELACETDAERGHREAAMEERRGQLEALRARLEG